MKPEPIITLTDLHFDYPPVLPDGGRVSVLRGIDLNVLPGEFVGVVGPNGVGKTTLLLILARIAPQITRGVITGEVNIVGRAGMLFQEADAQLFHSNVEAEVAWGLENLGLPVAEIDERLNWSLDALHIAHLRHATPGILSGGQQKRVALAATIAMKPDILLLDEPTAGLDPAARRDVLAALADLRKAYPLTVLMAENDAETVALFAERMIVLNEGHIVRDDSPRTIYREIAFLDSIGVPIPPAARLAHMLRLDGHDADFLTLQEATAMLKDYPLGS